MQQKPKLVSCRLTEADFEMLQDHAASLELSQSEYLRYLIRVPVEPSGVTKSGEYVVLDANTFGRIYSELVRWGRHYNQAVRALNTIALHMRRGKYDQEFFSAQIEKANERLEDTEAGRQDIIEQLDRLETLTLIGG